MKRIIREDYRVDDMPPFIVAMLNQYQQVLRVKDVVDKERVNLCWDDVVSRVEKGMKYCWDFIAEANFDPETDEVREISLEERREWTKNLDFWDRQDFCHALFANLLGGIIDAERERV